MPGHNFTVSPAVIPANHPGNITLTLTWSGESWVDGVTDFLLSAHTGVTRVSQSVAGPDSATVVVTTSGLTGTLTVAEDVTGSDTATVLVAIIRPVTEFTTAAVPGRIDARHSAGTPSPATAAGAGAGHGSSLPDASTFDAFGFDGGPAGSARTPGFASSAVASRPDPRRGAGVAR
jgi:hypothetical protein